MILSEDTICAIATPHGRSAIAIIRVSGQSSIEKIERIFVSNNKNKDSQSNVSLYKNPRKAIFGKIVSNGSIIDEVLILPFLKGASYTGEESVEIYCHGNPLIIEKILSLLYKNDIRQAEPGEFTKRAFLNNKLDLSQAQAVNEIILARSEKELQLALQLKDGNFRKEILQFKTKLIDITADLSAQLDFVEEDIDFGEKEKNIQSIQALINDIKNLLHLANRSEIFKTGLSLAIVGEVNVGKSSLLNYLWGKEKAIVSNIPGTTRDLVEATIQVNGVRLTLIDTAGIRETPSDEIEKIGIHKSYDKIKEADIIFWVVDVSIEPDKALEPFFKKEFSNITNIEEKLIVVINKIDLLDESEKIYQSWKNFIHKDELQKNIPFEHILISLTKNIHCDLIEEKIKKRIENLSPHTEGLSIAVWQKEILNKILEELQLGATNLQQDEPIEIVLSSFQNALDDFSLLTGEITNEHILGRIFSKFCIGK